MKSPFFLRLSLVILVVFTLYSCKKDPLKLKYTPEKFSNDSIALKEALTDYQYEKLVSAIDSLPEEEITGSQYGEIAGIYNVTVMKRFSKRFFKKNRIKKMGKDVRE